MNDLSSQNFIFNKDNLSKPSFSRGKKITTIVIVVVIVLGVALVLYLWRSLATYKIYSPVVDEIKTEPLPLEPPNSVTDEERLKSLQKVSDVPPINPNMTDQERLRLLNQPSKVSPL